MFADYFFHLEEDGSIRMDEELKASSLDAKVGDKFVLEMTEEGSIRFKKEKSVELT